MTRGVMMDLGWVGFTWQRMGKQGADGVQIWSVRFSADGKEVVAGAGSGKIMVYDIDAQRRTLSMSGHADDGECSITFDFPMYALC